MLPQRTTRYADLDDSSSEGNVPMLFASIGGLAAILFLAVAAYAVVSAIYSKAPALLAAALLMPTSFYAITLGAAAALAVLIAMGVWVSRSLRARRAGASL